MTGEYWEYCKWRAAHRVFSAVMGTMSTQAMLTAIGVGSSRAVPAAAALNWVLKDGLGKMGKLAVTAAFGRAFDSDLKRFRFVASVVMVRSADECTHGWGGDADAGVVMGVGAPLHAGGV